MNAVKLKEHRVKIVELELSFYHAHSTAKDAATASTYFNLWMRQCESLREIDTLIEESDASKLLEA